MDEAISIIEFTKFAISNIEMLDDAIDDTLSNINDYTDTAGEVLAPIKSALRIYNLVKRLKFKSFLKEYSRTVNESEDICVNDFEKLKKYISIQKNLEFVAETIDNAINSKSTLCSAILGYYAGSILSKSKFIEYEDTIIINALSIMTDRDVENFLELYSFAIKKFRENPKLDELRTCDLKDNNEISEINIDSFELEMTIEKLKSVQALGYSAGGLGSVGNAWGAFKFNNNTDYLYEIIQKSTVHISA